MVNRNKKKKRKNKWESHVQDVTGCNLEDLIFFRTRAMLSMNVKEAFRMDSLIRDWEVRNGD